jgi:hypothetical protein
VPPGSPPPGSVPPGSVPPGSVAPGYIPPGYGPQGPVPPGYGTPGSVPPPQGWTPQQPGYAPPQPAWVPDQPPKRRPRAGLFASIAAVGVLAAGGAATYVAFSSSTQHGSSSPKAAIQKVVGDLQNVDLVGLLDDLAPGERDAFVNPMREDVAHLKRLRVLKSTANPSAVSGVTFAAHNLSYAAKTVTINDHVQIVQLTGGTVDIASDANKFPFTAEFMKLLSRNSSSSMISSSHVDIAQQVGSSGPVRIAAEKVGGRWYASLAYTVADQASGHAVPSAADAIPAAGASSAEDAVRQEVMALLHGDARTAIALLSPAELAAAHDYGAMIVASAHMSAAKVSVQTLDFTSTPISGGAERVSLKKLVVGLPDGSRFSVVIDGGCVTADSAGQHKKYCATDAATAIVGALGLFLCPDSSGSSSSGGGSVSSTCGMKFTAAQKQAFSDLFTAVTKIGVASTQVNGKWYVSPVRSGVDIWGTLLSGLKGDDLLSLFQLGS